MENQQHLRNPYLLYISMAPSLFSCERFFFFFFLHHKQTADKIPLAFETNRSSWHATPKQGNIGTLLSVHASWQNNNHWEGISASKLSMVCLKTQSVQMELNHPFKMIHPRPLSSFFTSTANLPCNRKYRWRFCWACYMYLKGQVPFVVGNLHCDSPRLHTMQ